VIISAVQTRARKTTHKYGVAIPTDLRHAHALDKQNGNDVWEKALMKEMTNVGIAFEILEPEKNAPPGWSKISGRLVNGTKGPLGT
jgi:hypothetical protein